MKRNRKTFAALVEDVQVALESLEDSESDVRMAEANLERMRELRQQAVVTLANARDALFKEYPELKVEVSTSTNQPEDPAPTGPWDPEPVQVDDADDPRYTAGVGRTPSGPIEFSER